MKTCEKCGGLRATEPGGEFIAGTPCRCIEGDSTLELMGKERLTQPSVLRIRQLETVLNQCVVVLEYIQKYQGCPVNIRSAARDWPAAAKVALEGK